jgi:hypothetical protein
MTLPLLTANLKGPTMKECILKNRIDQVFTTHFKDYEGPPVHNQHTDPERPLTLMERAVLAARRYVGDTNRHKGIFYHPGTRNMPWQAKIGTKNIGYFHTLQEAVEARRKHLCEDT